MALQLDIPTAGGLTAPNAYVRISDARLGKGSIIVAVHCYLDADAAAAEQPTPLITPEFDRWKFDFDESEVIDSKSAFQIGYELLKTLPSFVGATDV